MSVYIDPKNPEYVIVDCRPDGYKGPRVRDKHLLSKVSLEEAQAMHDDMMRKPAEIKRPPVNTTLTGIYRQWIVYYRSNKAKSTALDAESCWGHLQKHFGHLLAKNITEVQIEKYKAEKLTERVRPKSPKTFKHRTINKHLTYFSSMLKWAARNKLCDPLPFTMPLFENKLTKAPKPRPITQEQITNIYHAIEEKYKLAFLLMADGGLRRNEALHLRREDVEYDSGLIFVTGKGSKERIVPVTTDRLKVELIKRVDTRGYYTLNPSTKKPYLTIRKALARAADKAGVDKNVYHHLLRHSFGTNATIAGVDLKAVQGIMGHASPETTQMYQHLAGDYLRDQGQKLNFRVHVDKKST